MSAEFRTDVRPLGRFYERPDVRQKVHYQFAYRFLPQYVHQNPAAFFRYLYDSGMDATLFVQSRWQMMEEMAGLIDVSAQGPVAARRVSDLRGRALSVTGRPFVLVEMPRPERPPLAHFVGVAQALPPGSAPPTARVFTLESSSGGGTEASALLCEITAEGTHLNTGLSVPAEAAAFVQAACARVGDMVVDAATIARLTADAAGAGGGPAGKPWWKFW